MKRWLISILATILCMGMGPGAVNAEIYRWVDADGNVQFGDKQPSNTRSETVELKHINTFQSVSVDELPDWVKADKKAITIYTAIWCGACNRAKQYFKQQNIPYREYDVESSSKGRKDFARLKGRGVPIILVGEKRMNGFSARRFEALYEG